GEILSAYEFGKVSNNPLDHMYIILFHLSIKSNLILISLCNFIKKKAESHCLDLTNTSASNQSVCVSRSIEDSSSISYFIIFLKQEILVFLSESILIIYMAPLYCHTLGQSCLRLKLPSLECFKNPSLFSSKRT